MILLLLMVRAMSGFCQSITDSVQLKALSFLHPQALVREARPQPTYTVIERMKALHVNGLSIAVIDEGKIDFEKSFGIRDGSQPAAMVETSTLFQCASIGKMITALAVLHLVKQKKISLDDPVNQRLSGWKLPPANGLEEEVTIRHLLSHAAGLEDEYGFEGYRAHTELPEIDAMLDGRRPANNRKKLIVKNKPGTVEKYSGGGFLIIQQLISELTGCPFDKFVDSIIFKPLQMHFSTYNYYPDEELEASVARGHHGNGKTDTERKYMVYPEKAAAGFWTTAHDLALLVIEIQKEKKGISSLVADSSLINEMLQPQINTTGLGVHLKGHKEVAAFWHAGNNAGYTGVLFGTLTGQGAIVLTNSDEGEMMMMEIIRSIADAYNWPAMQTQYIKETSGPAFDIYLGNYGGNGRKVSIGRDAKGIFLLTEGNKQGLTLYQARDGSFLIKEKPDHVRVSFIRDTHGGVKALQFWQHCGTATGTLEKTGSLSK